MRSDIGSLYPTIYRNILETDILTEVEDHQFDQWLLHMDSARDNQFVLTAEAEGIAAFERIYEIIPASGDSLAFRRERVLSRMRLQPPFTLRFLRQRLEESFGAGNYKVRLEADAYTLWVSITAKESAWYRETVTFLGKIIPANLICKLQTTLRPELPPAAVRVGAVTRSLVRHVHLYRAQQQGGTEHG